MVFSGYVPHMTHIVEIVADGRPGGGTTNVLGLAADLKASEGWKVSFVTQEGSYSLEKARKDGLDAYGLDFFSSRFNPLTAWKLWRLLRKLKPDLVHVNAARAGLPMLLVPGIGRGRRVPMIYTVRGYHFVGKSGISRKLAILVERLVSRRASCTVNVAKFEAGTAKENGILRDSDPQAVVYNGILPANFDGIKEKKRYDICFVGRMHRQKHPLFFVDVAAALKDRGYTFCMVGGGEMEAEVKAHAKALGVDTLIEFTGEKPHRAVLEHMAASRLLVMPSRWEGLPIVPAEAMYLGVPVVASTVSGTPEVVVNGKTGILLPEFDSAAYAAAIEKILGDAKLYKEMAATGRAHVEKNFLRSRTAEGYAAVMRKVLGV